MMLIMYFIMSTLLFTIGQMEDAFVACFRRFVRSGAKWPP
jgi:hypothetical protein